ncbi:hypothetical protein AUP68_18113 [Ilyonectria robusta]
MGRADSPNNVRRMTASIRRDRTQAEIELESSPSRASTPSQTQASTRPSTRSSTRSQASTRPRMKKTGSRQGRGTQASSRPSATPTPSGNSFIPATQSSLRDEIVVRL